MTFTLDKLNNQLKIIKNNVNLPELEKKAEQAQKEFLSIFESKGKEVGDIEQGLKVIADEGLGLAKETLAPIVGKLTEDVAVDLKKISTQKGNISTITGQAVDNGFLESAISNINTVGIEKTLKELSNNTEGINSALQSFAGEAETALTSLLNNSSFEGLAKDFVKEFSAIEEKVPDLTTFLQNELQTSITNATTGDTSVKSTIQNNLGNNFKSTELADKTIVVNNTGLFSGKSTPASYEFTYVNTVEELALELRNSERPFSQIIVEYTGEFLDDNFDAYDFHTLYSSIEYAGGDDEETLALNPGRGFDGIPYHYVIRKDGKLQRGRPLDIETVYPSDINYSNSIVIAVPGGYDVPIGTEDAKIAVNSGTTSSWYSFNQFLNVVYSMYPGIQVFASIELVNAGWSADAYIESLLGKRNNKQPSSSSLTRTDLVNARPL